jgi:deoxyribose-phosphate aldolase
MVLSVGKLIEGKEAEAAEEIRAIKEACGNATLKCILETGALKTPELIKLASEIAINNGANFIKTSTGKISPAATIDASRIMLEVIKGHFVNTGERIGFKAAGGISTYEDACAYINLVKNVIGEEWLKPELFRIGASRLVDNL